MTDSHLNSPSSPVPQDALFCAGCGKVHTGPRHPFCNSPSSPESVSPKLSEEEIDAIAAEWEKEPPPRRLTLAEKIDQMDEWDFENGCERPYR